MYNAPMPASTKLNSFIEAIMSITVQRMGGAYAGILGSSGADNDILIKLKRAAISYGRHYGNPVTNQVELMNLSQEIYGYLQTLQLTYTLTESEAGKLIDELQVLDDKLST
jgi:hypothetical protein